MKNKSIDGIWFYSEEDYTLATTIRDELGHKGKLKVSGSYIETKIDFLVDKINELVAEVNKLHEEKD